MLPLSLLVLFRLSLWTTVLRHLGRSDIPTQCIFVLDLPRINLATMGVIPLLPTCLPTVTVAATTVVATTITTWVAAVQAVPPRGQRQPRQLILQAPRHTALLPMARAPQAGATVATITTVCSVSSLSGWFALHLLTSLGVRMHEPVWIPLLHEYAPSAASK